MLTTRTPARASADRPINSRLGVRLASVAIAALVFLGVMAVPAMAANGTVDVAAGNTLSIRSTPSSSGTKLGSLADGAAVSLSCYTTGESVTGTFGTTNKWDKLTSGGYVSQAYVSVSGTLPSCTTSTTGNAVVDVAAGNTLTIRSTASTSGSSVGSYADNQRITVSCKTTGTTVSGTFGTTATWYKVSNGYVSAAYVKADATPGNCTTTTTPPSATSKVQTIINYGLAAMAKPNGYTGCWGDQYRMGKVASVGTWFGIGNTCGQNTYYLPAGHAGWDCSGLMVKMYAAAGITVPGSSSSIASGVPTVSVGGNSNKNLGLMKPGDMLVKSGSHVVMYIGNYNGVPSVIEATPISRQSNGYSDAIRVRSVSSLLTNADYKVVRPAGL